MATFGVRMKHSEQPKEMGRRRRRSAWLLAAGASQAEVARQVSVLCQTVMRWERVRQEGGVEASRGGFAIRASGAAQPCTTPGTRAATQRRRAGGGLLHGVMDFAADRATDRGEVRREDGVLVYPRTQPRYS